MELNLTQLCSTATSLVKGRTDVPLSEASFWANIAYQEVATRIRYATDEALAVSSTTSGENRLALPSNFAYPIQISNLSATGNRRELRGMEAHTFDSRGTALGIPEQYALYSTWMEVWPSPDSAYSIQLRYGTKMASLISSTATPVFDERWHFGVALLTAAYVAAARDDGESEAQNKARYLSYMGSTPNDMALRQRDKLAMRVQVIR
jgi:hypothetical protein